jgi:hypothetical protein
MLRCGAAVLWCFDGRALCGSPFRLCTPLHPPHHFSAVRGVPSSTALAGRKSALREFRNLLYMPTNCARSRWDIDGRLVIMRTQMTRTFTSTEKRVSRFLG